MQPTQPIDTLPEVVRNHIGPAPWSHSKFRVTLKILQVNSPKPGSVTMRPVEEINRYCEWVESVGDPNLLGATRAIQEMFSITDKDAKAILSSANSWADRVKMPAYYRRLSWGSRPRGGHKAKKQQPLEFKPEKSDIVFGDARFAHLEEELRRLDSLLKGLADVLDNNVIKVVRESEGRLERAEHRIQVLDEDVNSTQRSHTVLVEDLNKVIVSILAKGEAIAELAGKMTLIENKLRGVRKGPSRLTKLHREVQRRLRILVAGGK